MPSQLHRHDEAGHVHFWTISCYRRLSFLWHDALKQVVIEGLRMLQRDLGVCLIAYVVMPDHLHFIVLPHRRGDDTPIPISQVLHRFKRQIGMEAKDRLRDIWRHKRTLWAAPLNAWAAGEYPKQVVFNTRGYDFNITRFDTLVEKIDYCHKNPVSRGLVDTPEQWKWSSFRYYDRGDRSVLPMDWDGRWPIEW